MIGEPSFERSQIVRLIRRWGGITTDALLDPTTQFFTAPGVNGLIGYRAIAERAVVFGDPVCSPEDVVPLSQAFQSSCTEQKLPFIFLMASERYAQWAMQHLCKCSIQFGQELYVDPQCDPKNRHGTHASLIRRKMRHALHEGTTVSEYLSEDKSLEQQLEKIAEGWIGHRRGPQIHISNVHLFEDRDGKRWFYAQHKDQIVGVIVLNRLDARKGWLINHLMITPQAPHGTPELLLISALDALKVEGCTFATFGSVPAAQLGEIVGLDPFASWAATSVYKMVYHLFHLKGLGVFWGKFDPEASPSYLLFSKPKIGYHEIRALLSATHAL